MMNSTEGRTHGKDVLDYGGCLSKGHRIQDGEDYTKGNIEKNSPCVLTNCSRTAVITERVHRDSEIMHVTMMMQSNVADRYMFLEAEREIQSSDHFHRLQARLPALWPLSCEDSLAPVTFQSLHSLTSMSSSRSIFILPLWALLLKEIFEPDKVRREEVWVSAGRIFTRQSMQVTSYYVKFSASILYITEWGSTILDEWLFNRNLADELPRTIIVKS